MTIKVRIKSIEEIEANFARVYKDIGAKWEGLEENEIAEWNKYCGKTFEVEESAISDGFLTVDGGMFAATEYEIIES